jgi:hypothetical protein
MNHTQNIKYSFFENLFITNMVMAFGASVCLQLPLLAGPANAESVKPFEPPTVCELDSRDRIALVEPPANLLKQYQACVVEYSLDPAWHQAASWISDWRRSASCLYICDDKGIKLLANKRLLISLRYIIAQSIPLLVSADKDCRRTQIAMAASIDETMSSLEMGRASFGPAQCKAQRDTENTRKSLVMAQTFVVTTKEKIREYRSLTGQKSH